MGRDAGKKNHGSNAPFRSGKGRVYEGGVRVPYVVRYPGVTEAGKVFDGPVSALDIPATALAAAGILAPELDGVDLAPWLDGTRKDDPHPVLYWRLGASWAIREGDLKLLSDKGKPAELYDLAADPSEEKDLAAARPERVAELKQRWDAWNAQLVEPAFESNTERRKANKAQKGKKDQSE